MTWVGVGLGSDHAAAGNCGGMGRASPPHVTAAILFCGRTVSAWTFWACAVAQNDGRGGGGVVGMREGGP